MSFYLATDPLGCHAVPNREAVCIISRSLSIIVATGETQLCATSLEGRILRRRLKSERKAGRASLIQLSEEDGGHLLSVHGEKRPSRPSPSQARQRWCCTPLICTHPSLEVPVPAGSDISR